jgi:predicted P-loop ATPase
MHRLSQAETNQVKKFLSRQVDRYRPPYGRSVIEAPRRVVLNGTINPEGNAYLRDPTGARRFWPVETGRIDTDAIAQDRDQLWAEAVAMFHAGEAWWVQQDEQAAVEVEQAKRTDVDVWTDLISPFLKGRTSVTQLELFSMLNIPHKDVDYRHAARVGRVMKNLGWTAARTRALHDDQVVYRSPPTERLDGADEW